MHTLRLWLLQLEIHLQVAARRVRLSIHLAHQGCRLAGAVVGLVDL